MYMCKLQYAGIQLQKPDYDSIFNCNSTDSIIPIEHTVHL